MTRLYKILPLLVLLLIEACSHDNGSSRIDLQGRWAFRTDPHDSGIKERWFMMQMTDSVTLPGSMLTNGKGDEVSVNTNWTGGIWDSIWYSSPDFARYREPGNIKISFWLQPLKHYKGVAWYRKSVIIPPSWKNKSISLFFERCHWESTVWVDSVMIGSQNSLSTPHLYDLTTSMTPGCHEITVRIDNRIMETDPGQDAHSISDNTQTNWNGIIGAMTLTARPEVYIDDIHVSPQPSEKMARVRVRISSRVPEKTTAELIIGAATTKRRHMGLIASLKQTVEIKPGLNEYEYNFPLGKRIVLWDEFEPNTYTLNVRLKSRKMTDSRQTSFGMREFITNGTRFSVNNRPVFLRGTVECAVFPKTGYPPVSTEEWLKIFDKCRQFGLNHVRFHSWCPPEAAFSAADMKGIYLSVECPVWTSPGNGRPVDRFIYEESERIIAWYGNHPSFCMMTCGNEASGTNAIQFLTDFVNHWKEKDNRRVYTSASGFPESPASDYISTPLARLQQWGAGLSGPLNANHPSTSFDWSNRIDREKPTVSHETGQWCAYPNFGDSSRYEGVLKPKNLEIFYDRLCENKMSHLADSFLQASGKLQLICYKADIEAALRTRDMAGFQLLSLTDFPGQGTAPVGILNCFWQEKVYAEAAEFTKYCGPTVPLIRLGKMVFSGNEELNTAAQICHYGSSPLEKTAAGWIITDSKGSALASGEFPIINAGYGLSDIGVIRHKFGYIQKAEQLKITIFAGPFSNSWDIWVYPDNPPETEEMSKVMVTHVLDKKAIDYLEMGGNVLLTVKKGELRKEKGGSVVTGFSTIFWNTQWTGFSQPPFTMGLICNPAHPALAEFPTEWHSNYQWWDAMTNCSVIRLDAFSQQIKPIIRVIDDWFSARPLTLLFECRVGRGKMMVCGADLLTGRESRPEATQLLYSLRKYMSGDEFNPSATLGKEEIIELLTITRNDTLIDQITDN